MSADERAAVLLERAATLAPLRLERHQLNEMTMKGRKPMKIKELVEGTWLYDDIFGEGRQEGMDRGP